MAKTKTGVSKFHIEFKSPEQKLAWAAFQQHDVSIFFGPAGCGKTFLAMAFAISEVLQGKKRQIVLTRPIVEAGESLGFLPGDFHEKVNPYMMPLYDCFDKLMGNNGPQKTIIQNTLRVVPIAYMRGVTFSDSVCILDEAQNATRTQLKMFLTRFGENSKIIITADPTQSDIGAQSGFTEVVEKLSEVPGIGVIEFHADSIVRHPLVSAILKKLDELPIKKS